MSVKVYKDGKLQQIAGNADTRLTKDDFTSILGYTPASSDGSNATGEWDIDITGNAATATKLQTPRKINGVEFDGSTDINVVDDTSYQIAQNCRMEGAGWYRIMLTSGASRYHGIIEITRNWGSSLPPETLLLDISLSGGAVGGNFKIKELSHEGNAHITKIRYVSTEASPYANDAYIDLYYDSSKSSNTLVMVYDNKENRAFNINSELSSTNATLNIVSEELEEGYVSTVIELPQGSYFNKSKIDELTVGSITGVNYAGSSSVGGAATSADKLNTDAGSATQPVYFKDGIPVATTYTLGKSVPSDAVFTDTTYTSLKNPYSLTIQGNGTTLTNGTYDGSSAKTVNITPSAIGAAASSHTHSYAGSSSVGGAATTALECTGNSATATKLQTARKINGVEFDGSTDITVYDKTAYQEVTCKMAGVGWYRIMIGTGAFYHGILHIARSWGTETPESLTLDVARNGSPFDVSVLSHEGTRKITKIRMVQTTSSPYANTAYIDLYYNSTKAGNMCLLVLDKSGARTFRVNSELSTSDQTLNIVPEELEEGYTSTMIDISERGSYFPKSKIDALTVGSISGVNYAGSSSAGGAATTALECTGNSVSATQLETSRVLTIGNTGKSFNGSSDVSWTLSEIGAAPATHIHNYAGSSSAGGAATTALECTGNSATATKATQDANGNVIADTYATKTQIDSLNSNLGNNLLPNGQSIFHSSPYWWSDLMDISGDVNNIMTTGMANTIDGWAHLPNSEIPYIDGWGTLVCFCPGTSNNDILQLWYGMNTNGRLFSRKYRGGNWSAWSEILFNQLPSNYIPNLDTSTILDYLIKVNKSMYNLCNASSHPGLYADNYLFTHWDLLEITMDLTKTYSWQTIYDNTGSVYNRIQKKLETYGSHGKLLIPYGFTKIGGTTFANLANLTSIEIPSTVTIIGNYAFMGCSNATISIPSSVTSIGTDAFNGVAHIYYNGSATGAPWGATAYN